MNDRAVELLEQYDLEIVRTRKGRGSILADTSTGVYVFAEYCGTEEHLAAEHELLTQLSECEEVFVEQIVPTKEGALTVKDSDEVRYFLKTWQEGRECRVEEMGDCVLAMQQMAALHNCFEKVQTKAGALPCYLPETDYQKRNRELRRIRKYLKQKGSKQPFERLLWKVSDEFLAQGERLEEEWLEVISGEERPARRLCQGDFQYHNLIATRQGWFLMNFERCCLDSPVRDLALFLRKLLEKEDWSVALGQELLKVYEEERPLTKYDRLDLAFRLAYPEKYWKIANFYMNTPKSWIPAKNIQKLERVICQEAQKRTFLHTVFDNWQ